MSNGDHLLRQYADTILNEIMNADFIVIGTPVQTRAAHTQIGNRTVKNAFVIPK